MSELPSGRETPSSNLDFKPIDEVDERLSLNASVESIERHFESINLVAVGTAQRLVRSSDTWLAALEERHARLSRELADRRELLAVLDRQIAEEQEHAGALSQSVAVWAKELQRNVSSMRSEVVADVEGVEQQAHEVESLVDSLLASIHGPVTTDRGKSAADSRAGEAAHAADGPTEPAEAAPASELTGGGAVQASHATGEQPEASKASLISSEGSDFTTPAGIGEPSNPSPAAQMPEQSSSTAGQPAEGVKRPVPDRRGWPKRLVDFLFPE